MVVYSNVFQDYKLFCREYEDISGELSDEKKGMFNQTIKVQPLTDEEISIINSEEFIENKKKELVVKKFSKKDVIRIIQMIVLFLKNFIRFTSLQSAKRYNSVISV